MTIVSKPTPEVTLQLLLSLQGCNPGPLDGIIGPKTETALSVFQSSLSLEKILLHVDALEEQLHSSSASQSRTDIPDAPIRRNTGFPVNDGMELLGRPH